MSTAEFNSCLGGETGTQFSATKPQSNSFALGSDYQHFFSKIWLLNCSTESFKRFWEIF